MVWFVFAFLAALFQSISDVFNKKSLKNVDEYIVSWSLTFFALPFLILLLYFGIPSLGNQFWIALFIAGTLQVIATILYLKALKYSDLSITAPMATFTPLFLLITSPLIVNEFPNFLGLIGILLIVIGSYVLNIKEKFKGYLAPFKALLKEKGPKLMLVVAFIWSITANIDKIGIQNSSPMFWPLATNIFRTLLMSLVVLSISQKNVKQIPTNLKTLVPVGFFVALTWIFYAIAINLALVAYVISIKRTSAILSVLFGYLIFKEKGIKERLIGAVIMVLGVILIALS